MVDSQPAPLDDADFVRPQEDRARRIVFLGLALVVLGGGLLLNVRADQKVQFVGMRTPLPETCTFQHTFHVDCPLCGLTRSVIHALHGRWLAACFVNPAGLLVLLLALWQIVWFLVLPRSLHSHPWLKPVSRSLLLLAGLTAILQWIPKILAVFLSPTHHSALH